MLLYRGHWIENLAAELLIETQSKQPTSVSSSLQPDCPPLPPPLAFVPTRRLIHLDWNLHHNIAAGGLVSGRACPERDPKDLEKENHTQPQNLFSFAG